eukprot:gene11815-11959_t
MHQWCAVCAYLLAIYLQRSAAVLLSTRPGNVLTLLLTDCSKYQDWQTIAAAYAWRKSKQPGSLVRVANCNPEDSQNYDHRMLDYVQTHMAPQFVYNEELDDWYAPYNKPAAVVDFFKHNDPKEEYVAVLDSDMLLRKPFDPKQLNVTRGWALAADYNYLKGVDNDLAMRHVPYLAPRNDTLAGAVGRRGDRVGGPYYMHKDDLKRLAPAWFNWTRIMRTDMEAYKDSGDDAGSKPGDRIWIAEMYGYTFGAANLDIWHRWADDFMMYPTYTPSHIYNVIHYGLVYNVSGWSFNKHWYFDFDASKCPPWDLSNERPETGIFPPPPSPGKLSQKDYITHYTDLLSVWVISLVNAALCDYHAFALHFAIEQDLKWHESQWDCVDHNEECEMWAERGECVDSADYMQEHCSLSCKLCTPKSPAPQGPDDLQPVTVEGLIKEMGGVVPDLADGSDTSADSDAIARPAATASAQPVAGSGGRPDEQAAMRKLYQPSTLGYAALVQRCTALANLNDQQLRDCVKAASFKLEYPGTVGSTHSNAVACGEGGAAADLSAAVLLSSRPGNVLILLLTDCAKYQDWQTIAAVYAWRHSKQPGSLVRVANCNEHDSKTYDRRMLDYVQTHMAPQFAFNKELNDWYAAYNKPGAVVDFFKHNDPKEEYVAVLDSDMLLRKPFDPKQLNVTRGWALAAHYDYLKGAVGRRGDRVGGPYYMHKDDLKRLAPAWFNWTRIMRTDMEAYKDSGDTAATKPGDRIWIAEMYGYTFGAANLGIWHRWSPDFMLYPSYTPSYVPHVIHYGLVYHVGDWSFDKHWYFHFDAHKCPPWDLSKERPEAGIFPPPPSPDKLSQKDFLTHYKDLLSVWVISLVNAALCDYHAFALHFAIEQDLKWHESQWDCVDHNRGECEKSAAYMKEHCSLSCKLCTPKSPAPQGPDDLQPVTVESLIKEMGGVVPDLADGSDTSADSDAAVRPAAAARSGGRPDEQAAMRKLYQPSTLGYAALVQRCTALANLNDQQLRDCVKAASFKLEYPGTVGSTHIVSNAVAGRAAGAAADLAMLHAQHHADLRAIEDVLSTRMTGAKGGLTFLEQLVAVAVVAGVAWWGHHKLQKYRQARAKAAHNRRD